MEKKLKIVVPVDFSAASLKAIEFLKLSAAKADIDAQLVHVVQVNEEDWVCNAENNETIDRKALQQQEQVALQKFKDLQQQLDFQFSYQVLYGGLTTSLVKFATQQQADLIVMGTKGADGWLERISGSETQQVVRHATIPVISIHEHALVSP
ncbi:MAG: universal stress protein, partial [Hymenobacteraceae bacterium]|nr:universal stress protein [Hymenobacteraceae bacterium]MDX5397137.1 universal stress protein [Hymenobacteraceae bacterium]MDX5513215.1 universal stress protein [Hymenobacteraceae bacterium]